MNYVDLDPMVKWQKKEEVSLWVFIFFIFYFFNAWGYYFWVTKWNESQVTLMLNLFTTQPFRSEEPPLFWVHVCSSIPYTCPWFCSCGQQPLHEDISVISLKFEGEIWEENYTEFEKEKGEKKKKGKVGSKSKRREPGPTTAPGDRDALVTSNSSNTLIVAANIKTAIAGFNSKSLFYFIHFQNYNPK